MAIRPVDLQQVVMKTPEITRDTAAQQQAAAAQQAQVGDLTRREAQRAETVQQFDEAGGVAVRERQAGGGKHEQPDREQEQSAAAEELDVQRSAQAPRLGRHIDLQA